MSIDSAIKEATEILNRNSVASPFLEARILLSYILKIPTSEIILNPHKYLISHDQKKKFFDLLHQRAKKIPLAYLIKKREFFGNEFYVDENVLDPRPDSETLIELIIQKYDKNSALKICEIGCGSGCLIISLLKYFNNWSGCAIDISKQALAVAKHNAQKHFLESKMTFLESNIFNNFNEEEKFDIIISNPPYIPTLEIDNLQDEVRIFEPRIALDGGLDGLDFYRIIAKDSGKFLNKNGKIFLEIGHNQQDDVKKIFSQNNYEFSDCKFDLNGIARALEFKVFI